ncbi:MAG: hypothetical protein M9947_14670 [Thermomicrobiales bacterium]|nr:hypothetical protein [Thermomicrobiales bacterium]
MKPRVVSLASIAIAMLAALVTLTPALAQDATPTVDQAPDIASAELRPWIVSEPFAPAPDECTVESVDVSAISTTLATPVPISAPDVTSHGIEAMQITGLADAATIDGVLDTLTLFWACTNAGNRAAVAALMSPAAAADFYGIDLSLTGADLDDAVEIALSNRGDREEEERASIDGVLTIAYLGDGRTGALVLNTDPFVNDGDQVLDLFVFVNVNGVFQVDSVVFDPFDLSPGYGFEKS